jgi:hypothetical protein
MRVSRRSRSKATRVGPIVYPMKSGLVDGDDPVRERIGSYLGSQDLPGLLKEMRCPDHSSMPSRIG